MKNVETASNFGVCKGWRRLVVGKFKKSFYDCRRKGENILERADSKKKDFVCPGRQSLCVSWFLAWFTAAGGNISSSLRPGITFLLLQ